jgi:hypothetical protein
MTGVIKKTSEGREAIVKTCNDVMNSGDWRAKKGRDFDNPSPCAWRTSLIQVLRRGLQDAGAEFL